MSRGFGSGGGGPFGNLMKQASQMQAKIAQVQEELQSKSYEASSGGGMIQVVINGKHEIQSMKINPEVINPQDPEMLADLVTVAFNEALSKSQADHKESMSKVTGGANFPGLF